MIWKWRSK